MCRKKNFPKIWYNINKQKLIIKYELTCSNTSINNLITMTANKIGCNYKHILIT